MNGKYNSVPFLPNRLVSLHLHFLMDGFILCYSLIDAIYKDVFVLIFLLPLKVFRDQFYGLETVL